MVVVYIVSVFVSQNLSEKNVLFQGKFLGAGVDKMGGKLGLDLLQVCIRKYGIPLI